MQNIGDSVLDRMLVIVLLGEDSVTEAFSRNEIETHHATGRIIMREAMARRAHLHKSALSPAVAFLDESRGLFFKGIRIAFVCGFPQTIADAEMLVKSCPHLVTFSFEPPGTRYPAADVRSLLSRGKFHSVDSTRQLRKQGKFIRGRIDLLLSEIFVSRQAAAIPSVPLAQPAFA